MSRADALAEAASGRHKAGDTRAALSLVDEALAIDSDHRRSLLLKARLQMAFAPMAAAASARQVCAQNTADVEAFGLLGQALSAAGRAGEAVEAFRRAAEMAPLDAAVLSNLAIAELRGGDARGALETARKAIAAGPGLPDAHAASGHALCQLGSHPEALAAFTKVLSLRPRSVDALAGIARVYRQLGRPSTAVMALQRAADMAPHSVEALVDLASGYREMGEFGHALDTHRRMVALSRDVSPFHGNMMLDLQYQPDVGVAEATAAARSWGIRHVAATPAVKRASAATASRTDGRLHIGYVSADFFRHPVGWLGGAAIAAHDKRSMHVTVYANTTREDDLTRRLKGAVDAWVPVHDLDDAALAERIAADGIDVLVDLSGHTAGNRLGAFARRPAATQVSWLGYFATTGLPTIDYVLLDEAHATPAMQAAFTERIHCLPRIRFAYTPPDDAPGVVVPPCARKGHVTFGSFNNIAKVNPAVIATWARILHAVPHSRLHLKWRTLADPFLCDRIAHAFAQHDIDGTRLEFEGASPFAEMLARYGEIDVALDPFPFNGGVTSCEALWMGVPLVTCPGDRLVSRQGHAIVEAIGEAAWSAATHDGYVARAVALAADPERLRALRHDLRRRMRASPLLDGAGLARALEAAYREFTAATRGQ